MKPKFIQHLFNYDFKKQENFKGSFKVDFGRDINNDYTQDPNGDFGEFSLKILTLVIGGSTILIETLGRVRGFLNPISFIMGFLTVSLSLLLGLKWIKILASEMGRVKPLWYLFWSFQFFWAYFKAPLDVDGLFYHLTLVLEALQNNQWGHSQILTWHIQNAPHLGEIPTLLWLGFFKFFDPVVSMSYRFSQWGHFSTMVLFISAIYRVAKRLNLKNTMLFIALMVSIPIVIKQSFSHYVDFYSWTTWLLAISLILNPLKKSQTFFLVTAIALHCGTKFSGPVTALSLLLAQIYILKINKIPGQIRRFEWATILFGILLGSASFMLTNWIRYSNPIFPLFSFEEAIPSQLGISSDLKAPLQNISKFAVPFKNFFSFEETAVYDQNQGAMGLIGMLGFFVTLLVFILNFKKPLRLPVYPSEIFVASSLLYFILMPGRLVPRHGFGLALGVIFLSWSYFKHNSFLTKKLLWTLLCFQLIYAIPDRVMFRGTRLTKDFGTALGIIKSNFNDIVNYGEPQDISRYFHYPYVAKLRRNEPRHVIVDSSGIELPALYFGRHFSNTVEFNQSYCKYPFCK